MIPRKPVANIIVFQPKPEASGPEGPGPQANVAPRKRPTQEPNQYSRRSFLAMFMAGASVRHAARFHGQAEATVETAIRQELAMGGVYTRNGIRLTDRQVWLKRAA